MATKRRSPDPDAPAAGYLRVSHIIFPEGCDGPAAHAAHVDALRALRRAELEADAARAGETIGLWYDDMGVSGRGDALERRVAFERLRGDALRGRVRAVYARDLSRLFRDLVQQELWFCDMEDAGVAVHA